MILSSSPPDDVETRGLQDPDPQDAEGKKYGDPAEHFPFLMGEVEEHG